jgi:hypothetical protein
MKWVRQDQPIHSLTYAGEKYQGHDTEVFAFYASPITLGEAKAGHEVPRRRLIHGGGGTAFAEWVQFWAKRGYAAIAMDLNGSRPPEVEFDTKGMSPSATVIAAPARDCRTAARRTAILKNSTASRPPTRATTGPSTPPRV